MASGKIAVCFLSFAAVGFAFETPNLFSSPDFLLKLMPTSRASQLFAETGSATYEYKTAWFAAYVDNFNFNGPTSQDTYQERYLYNDTWWKGPGYPIFFYTGNEGFIELFAENAGWMWELAPQFGALLVFAEHRFYGQSLPFGADSGNEAHFGLLSHEQALADYAVLLDSLKANLSASDSPVVSFGGSYGGMLSAWFRIKYPSAVVGAIASSAPILQIPGIMQPGGYWKIITDDYRAANPIAPEAIYNTWQAMFELAVSESGRALIAQQLRLCSPLQEPGDVWLPINWLVTALGFSAMADYPYPANFLGPMPAWPVAAQAAYFKSANAPPGDLLQAMADGVASIFYNYTGQAGPCFNLTTQDPPGVQGDFWGAQCCHEIAQPIGQYGLPNDFLWPAPFNLTDFIIGCQYQFNGTTPRPFWIRQQYGGLDLRGTSNIVFTNGELDPWKAGGVTQNVTGAPSIIALVIAQAAHHLDLRSSNAADPPSVVEARLVSLAAIKQWLNDFYKSRDQSLRF